MQSNVISELGCVYYISTRVLAQSTCISAEITAMSQSAIEMDSGDISELQPDMLATLE